MGKRIFGKGKSGLLYFAQNPSFHHLTKIGWTEKLDIKDRGLSASNVPDDFDYIEVFQCEDAEWAEERVHLAFADYRHKSNTDRRTEFFWSGVVPKAIEFARDLKGVKIVTEDETEEVEAVDEKGERTTIKRPKLTILEYGIPIGAKLVFVRDSSILGIVVNEKQIEVNGKKDSLTAHAARILKGQFNWSTEHSVQGTAFWLYNGKKLTDIRKEKEAEDQGLTPR